MQVTSGCRLKRSCSLPAGGTGALALAQLSALAVTMAQITSQQALVVESKARSQVLLSLLVDPALMLVDLAQAQTLAPASTMEPALVLVHTLAEMLLQVCYSAVIVCFLLPKSL